MYAAVSSAIPPPCATLCRAKRDFWAKQLAGLIGMFMAVAILAVACTHETGPDHGSAMYESNGYDDNMGGGCGGPSEWDDHDPIPEEDDAIPEHDDIEHSGTNFDAVPGAPLGVDPGTGGDWRIGGDTGGSGGSAGCSIDDDWCGADEY